MEVRYHEQECKHALASAKHLERAGVRQRWTRTAEHGQGSVCRAERVEGAARSGAALLRFALVSQLILLSSLLFQSVVLAEPNGFNTIIYGPINTTWDGTDYTEVGIVAGSRYDAALIAMGEFGSKSQLTEDMLAKLSNGDTGGKFYEFAQQFENPPVDGMTITPSGVAPGFWSTAYGIYGEGNVWHLEYTGQQLASAKEDFAVIKNGGSLGGNMPLTGDYVEFNVVSVGDSVPDYFKSATKVRIQKDKFNFTELGPTIATLRISNMSENSGGGIANSMTFDLGITSTLEPRSNGGYTMVTPSGGKYGYFSGNGLYARCAVTNNVLEVVPTSSMTLTMRYDGPRTDTVSVLASQILAVYGGSGSINPVVPPNNWPEGGGGTTGPTEPPEQPEPEPPTVDPPEYTEPTVDPPITTQPPDLPIHDPVVPYEPVVTVNPTNTTSLDYTPWLEAILNELRNEHRDLVTIGGDIISDLDLHCNHITSTIRGQTGWLWTNLSNKLNWMVTTIGNRMHVEAIWLQSALRVDMWQVNAHLESYLRDSFAWLAQEFEYVRYDDSSLRVILLRIYQKAFELDRIAESIVDYSDLLTTIDGHVVDVLHAIEALEPSEGDENETEITVNLGQLAGFDFGALVDLDVGRLVEFWNAFDGTFTVAPDLDFSLRVDAISDGLDDVVRLLTSISETLGGIATVEQDIYALLDDMEIKDYTQRLLSIDNHIVDVLHAIESLDLTVPPEVDYSDVLAYIAGDLDLLVEGQNVISSDIGNVLGLLAEISGKLDNIGKRQPRNWDFPEPHEDPDTHEWLVPVGTREIDGHPVAVYRPVKEVLNFNALEDAFKELCRHFPFSMLNKLVQVAVWLTRTGVPPRFNLPVPNPADWSTPASIEVDLRPFDPVAAVARMGILLWAIVRISSRTIDMWVREG